MSTQSANTRRIPNPVYAAAGAGDLAYQQLRLLPAKAIELSGRVAALRPVVTDAVTNVVADPAKQFDVQRLRGDVERLRIVARRNAEVLRTQADTLADTLRTQAVAVYADLVARGEKVVGGPYKELEPAGDVVPEITASEGKPAPASTTGAAAAAGPGTGKSPAKAVKKATRPAAVKQ
jgi:heparin binding hemagglutinin HbhA